MKWPVVDDNDWSALDTPVSMASAVPSPRGLTGQYSILIVCLSIDLEL